MSYGRGVNVSHYLRNLNVQEPVVEETFVTEEDLAKDLELFTNTEFFDYDTGRNTDYQAPPVKPEVTQSPAEDVTPTDPILADFSGNFDFMPGDFSFGDFSSTYTSPTVPAFPDSLGNHHLQPVQPSPQAAAYPPPVPQHHHQQHHHQPRFAPPPAPGRIGDGGAGEKRKAEEISAAPNGRVLSFEDVSRLAAEEDKRKRNTAASARFRIKKKQREQALEKSAKEMTEKVTILEGRISALETENKWLKSLVTEKHGGRDDILEKLLKEFTANEGGNNSRKGGAAANGSGGGSGNGEAKDSINAAGSTSSSDSDDDKASKRND